MDDNKTKKPEEGETPEIDSKKPQKKKTDKEKDKDKKKKKEKKESESDSGSDSEFKRYHRKYRGQKSNDFTNKSDNINKNLVYIQFKK